MPSDKLRLRRDRRACVGERFFVRRAHQGGLAERKAMIDRDHDLPVVRQASRRLQDRQHAKTAFSAPATEDHVNAGIADQRITRRGLCPNR